MKDDFPVPVNPKTAIKILLEGVIEPALETLFFDGPLTLVLGDLTTSRLE